MASVILPAHGASKCESDITRKYTPQKLTGEIAQDPEYSAIYTKLSNENETNYQNWLNATVTEARRGDCNYQPFTCEVGQKNKDCVPQGCWELHKRDDAFIKNDAFDAFIKQKIATECTKPENITITGKIADIKNLPSKPCIHYPTQFAKNNLKTNSDGSFTYTVSSNTKNIWLSCCEGHYNIQRSVPADGNLGTFNLNCKPDITNTPATPAKKSDEKPAAKTEPRVNDYINVNGHVYEADTNTPIANVTISGGGVTATTGTDGAFTITQIPGGTALVLTHTDYDKYTTEKHHKPDNDAKTYYMKPNTRTKKQRECAAKTPPQDVDKNMLGRWHCVDSAETKAARETKKQNDKNLKTFIDDIEKLDRAFDKKIKELAKSAQGDSK